MQLFTATDMDTNLAIAYGQFIHACANLERSIETALNRLTPTTTEMADAMFSRNSVTRNLEILKSLMALPDVPLNEANKQDMVETAKKAEALLQKRNTIVHNVIVLGDNGPMSVVNRGGGSKSYMEPITTDQISALKDEVLKLCTLFMLAPRPEYDLKKWGSAPREYNLKSPQPKPKDPE